MFFYVVGLFYQPPHPIYIPLIEDSTPPLHMERGRGEVG